MGCYIDLDLNSLPKLTDDHVTLAFLHDHHRDHGLSKRKTRDTNVRQYGESKSRVAEMSGRRTLARWHVRKTICLA